MHVLIKNVSYCVWQFGLREASVVKKMLRVGLIISEI